MRHVMYGGKSLLMEDASADTLVEYAAAVAADASGETVRLRALGDDGNEVDVAFLLNAGTVLVVESASGDLPLPANDERVEEMCAALARRRNPPSVQSEPVGDLLIADDEDY